MSKVVRLPQYKWSDHEREVEYHLPDSWDVTTYNFAGANRPVLSPAQIKAAITTPIGSPRLKDIARGKKNVVIIFEDMTRPARLSRVVPVLLEELAEANIKNDQIEFICANGTHQNWTLDDFKKKLGADIPSRFLVFNHCPFMNCTPLGKTSYGTRVEVNTEVMSCDLKITLSGNLMHGSYGISGGGKTVMPGVSSYDAIAEHHMLTHKTFQQNRKQAGFVNERGFAQGNSMALDAMEMAKMVGIDFSVNLMQNNWGEPVAIFAGALEPAYWAAVEDAKPHFQVSCPKDNDIVIANTFAKANEAFVVFNDGVQYVKPSGGSLIIITNVSSGQLVHHLYSAFGKNIGGRSWSPSYRLAIPGNVNHFIFYSEFLEAKLLDTIAEKDRAKVSYLVNWTDVVLSLQNWHGDNAKVAVLTDNTI